MIRHHAQSADQDAASQQNFSDEKGVFENLTSCVQTARRFLSNASVASSTMSAAGASVSGTEPTTGVGIHLMSDLGGSLSGEDRSRIESWVRPLERPGSGALEGTVFRSMFGEVQMSAMVNDGVDEDDEYDLEYELTRAFLQNGQAKVEKGDYAGAEACFRKALTKLESHAFDHKIALMPSDVRLMLASACVKQNKFDDAESLLLPLSSSRDASAALQTYAANHLLGELYLQKGDYTQAETSTISAAKGRRKHLGKTHPLYAESIWLLVQMYSAKGDEAEAEVWQTFLPPSLQPLSERYISNPVNTPPESFLVPEKPAISKTKLPKSSKTSFFSPQESQQQSDLTQQRSKSPLLSPASQLSFPTRFETQESNLLATPSSPTNPFSSGSLTMTSISDHSVSVPRRSQSSDLPPSESLHSVETLNLQHTIIVSRFSVIQRLCNGGDRLQAAEEALKYLQEYVSDPRSMPYWSEIRDNVSNGDTHGLAGTGYGFAPLHFFASLSKECAFEVQVLIDYGVDVNAITHVKSACRRPVHYTALQIAAECGHTNIVRLLSAASGIDLECRNSDGLTPLFIAWKHGHIGVVKILLDRGASSNGSPNVWQGNCLLHGAAWLCNLEVTKHLLSRPNVEVNARNNVGSTPLIAAVISSDIADERVRRAKIASRLPVLRALLSAGANYRLRNNAGRNAMYYAELEKNPAVVALLEGRGASREIGEAHPLHPPDVIAALFKRVVYSPQRLEAKHLRQSVRLQSGIHSKKGVPTMIVL
jgi:tetratricopeptide (TPR) repeat protein